MFCMQLPHCQRHNALSLLCLSSSLSSLISFPFSFPKSPPLWPSSPSTSGSSAACQPPWSGWASGRRGGGGGRAQASGRRGGGGGRARAGRHRRPCSPSRRPSRCSQLAQAGAATAASSPRAAAPRARAHNSVGPAPAHRHPVPPAPPTPAAPLRRARRGGRRSVGAAARSFSVDLPAHRVQVRLRRARRPPAGSMPPRQRPLLLLSPERVRGRRQTRRLLPHSVREVGGGRGVSFLQRPERERGRRRPRPRIPFLQSA